MSGDAVLDRKVLDTLRQLTPPGEPDVLSEVLRMFLSEVPRRIEKLRNAFAAGDIEEVQRSAHSLKGSAGNIGARAMLEICRQLDERSKAGELAALAPLIDALVAEFSRVETEISRVIHVS